MGDNLRKRLAEAFTESIARVDALIAEAKLAEADRAAPKPTSWHGSRPAHENHIVVAAWKERDEALSRAEAAERALFECAKWSGADMSDGPPANLPECAVEEVRQLRQDGDAVDEALEAAERERDAAKAEAMAVYDAAKTVLSNEGVEPTLDYFEHIIGTMGHGYVIEGLARILSERDERDRRLEAAERERDSLRLELEGAAYALGIAMLLIGQRGFDGQCPLCQCGFSDKEGS